MWLSFLALFNYGSKDDSARAVYRPSVTAFSTVRISGQKFQASSPNKIPLSSLSLFSVSSLYLSQQVSTQLTDTIQGLGCNPATAPKPALVGLQNQQALTLKAHVNQFNQESDRIKDLYRLAHTLQPSRVDSYAGLSGLHPSLSLWLFKTGFLCAAL